MENIGQDDVIVAVPTFEKRRRGKPPLQPYLTPEERKEQWEKANAARPPEEREVQIAPLVYMSDKAAFRALVVSRDGADVEARSTGLVFKDMIDVYRQAGEPGLNVGELESDEEVVSLQSYVYEADKEAFKAIRGVGIQGRHIFRHLLRLYEKAKG